MIEVASHDYFYIVWRKAYNAPFVRQMLQLDQLVHKAEKTVRDIGAFLDRRHMLVNLPDFSARQTPLMSASKSMYDAWALAIS